MTEKTQMDSFSAAQPNLFSAGEASWFPKPMMANPALAAPAALPSMPPAFKPKWYKTRWIYIVIAIVIVLLLIGYAMRSRFMGGSKLSGPYTAAIKSIGNAERQADLQEWSKLWGMSKRPAVKRVLAEVLNSELSPSGGAQQQQHQTMSAPQPQISNETPAAPPAVDPAFTVA
jgi:hypothetical protein